MKNKNPLFLLLLGFLFCVSLPETLRADDIQVAMVIASSGAKQYITILPKGGLSISKKGSITGDEIFTLSNLSGAEIKGDGQAKIRFNDSVWVRDSNNSISRYPIKAMKGLPDLFELKDAGGFFRIQVPGGGWIGGISEDRRSLRVVDSEEDALQIEFVVNPKG